MYETSFTDKRRSSFLFTENHIFIEEEINPADKVVIVEEVLDRINKIVLETWWISKQPPEAFYKKVVLKNFAIFNQSINRMYSDYSCHFKLN